MITTIKEFRKLNERLDIDVVPKDKNDLINLINYNMNEYGDNCNLNFIDTSNITDMSELFKNSNFNGYIDEWNTSMVTDMEGMFYDSKFNKDISKWNTENVTILVGMFSNSKFNQDISNWDVSNVIDMSWMFYINEIFDKNLDMWKLHKDCSTINMFKNSKLEKEGNLPSWYINN